MSNQDLSDVTMELGISDKLCDILDELHMILCVLTSQKEAISNYRVALMESQFHSSCHNNLGRDISEEFKRTEEKLQSNISKIESQRDIAVRVTTLLQLKHANLANRQARLANEQASRSRRQQNLFMAFSIATSVYVRLCEYSCPVLVS